MRIAEIDYDISVPWASIAEVQGKFVAPPHSLSIEMPLERVTSHRAVHLELLVEGEEIARFPVSVLSCWQWPHFREARPISSAFVLPGDEVVTWTALAASARNTQTRGEPPLPELASSRSGEASFKILRALYEYLAESCAIEYEMPRLETDEWCATSYQTVHPPHEILRHPEDRRARATCLDLTLFVAGCLESIGLQPLLLFAGGPEEAPTHAFLGCRDGRSQRFQPVLTDCDLLREEVKHDEILVMETTGVCVGNHRLSFARAAEVARDRVLGGIRIHAIDVSASRPPLGNVRPVTLPNDPVVQSALWRAEKFVLDLETKQKQTLHIFYGLCAAEGALLGRLLKRCGSSLEEVKRVSSVGDAPSSGSTTFCGRFSTTRAAMSEGSCRRQDVSTPTLSSSSIGNGRDRGKEPHPRHSKPGVGNSSKPGSSGRGGRKAVREREQELIHRTLSGERAAFDQLLQPHEPSLRRFLRDQLTPRPETSVEEALQEVRLYIYRRLDRYDSSYPFLVFARALARNIIKRFLYQRTDHSPNRASDDQEGKTAGMEELSPLDLEKLPKTLREIMGEGRFRSPGDLPPPSREFLELFEIFLRHGGYPHQQVSFGYSVLIWGRPKRVVRNSGKQKEEADSQSLVRDLSEKVPITGDPDRVVREVGPERLEPAAGDMLDEIGRTLQLDPVYMRRVRRPIDHRLQMHVEELFSGDATSLKIFADLKHRRTADTRLEEYFGKDPRKSIADWTRIAKERIRRAVESSDSRNRIPVMPRRTPREP
jgi:DNA-directed RNA polymerase specialized sigma24 family protein